MKTETLNAEEACRNMSVAAHLRIRLLFLNTPTSPRHETLDSPT
jgi:hypothetical protein